MQGSGAAERKDGKLPRIDAAANGHEPDAFSHMRVDDAVDPLGGRHAVYAEPGGEVVDSMLRRAPIEARSTAEEIVGIEKSEHQIGISDRRFDASVAIAGRPWLCASAFGPYMK